MGSWADFVAAVEADMRTFDPSTVTPGWVGVFGPLAWPLDTVRGSAVELEEPVPSVLPNSPTAWLQWSLDPAEPMTNVAVNARSQQRHVAVFSLVIQHGADTSFVTGIVDALFDHLEARAGESGRAYHFQARQIGSFLIFWPWVALDIRVPVFQRSRNP